MRGAAAQRAGARIPDAVLLGDELGIARLLRVVAVMADEEVPAHRRVFGRERVKGRDVVVRAASARRIAAGLEDDDGKTRLGEPRRDRAAAGAGSDDDVVGFEAVLAGPARAARPRRRRSTT